MRWQIAYNVIMTLAVAGLCFAYVIAERSDSTLARDALVYARSTQKQIRYINQQSDNRYNELSGVMFMMHVTMSNLTAGVAEHIEWAESTVSAPVPIAVVDPVVTSYVTTIVERIVYTNDCGAGCYDRCPLMP